jgi:hypothetical protein
MVMTVLVVVIHVNFRGLPIDREISNSTYLLIVSRKA